MILKRLHIENFGKLQNCDIDFSKGINEFCEDNGFGKTTLSIFIKAMFYGMPASRDNLKMERKKYMPWQGGNFGGYIEYEQAEESFRLTRFFGKTPEGDSFELLNLGTNKLVTLRGAEPGEYIWGVGKDSFEKTAFFPQLNFSEISNQQISANVLGLDKFKYDLANLNTAVSTIKKKLTEVKRDKPKKEDVDRLKRKLQDQILQLAELENEFKNVEKQIIESEKQLEFASGKVATAKNSYDLQMREYETKQRLEENLLKKQAELNKLLIELNEINSKVSQSNAIKSKSQNAIWKVAVFVLTALFIIGAVVCAAVVNSLVGAVCCSVAGAITIGAGVFFFLKRKTKSSGVNTEDKNQTIGNQITLCKKEIALIEDNLKGYTSVNRPDVEIVEKLNSGLYQSKLDLQNLAYKRDVLMQKIDNLQDDADVLKEDIICKEEDSLLQDKKIQLLNLTKEFLSMANENVSARFVEPANKAIKNVLTKFDMKNREFVVDSNFDIKEVTPVGIKEQAYSSQGYQDILSFSVRVYLLNEIYKQEKPPIILDDTFVNLDNENMLRAREILRELSEEYQIIYLCCNSRCKVK